MDIHLGHGGSRCPNTDSFGIEPEADEDQWEDIESSDKPAHLRRPEHGEYITIIDTTGVHFWNITYCCCSDSPAKHKQLFHARLFAASTIKPRTAFTFRVLDDFLMDNVECGTSAMNYFSKLRRITSNAFPHMVPVSSKVCRHVRH